MWRKEIIPVRVQVCIHKSSIQTERKSSSQWQLYGHLFTISHWEDAGKSLAESPKKKKKKKKKNKLAMLTGIFIIKPRSQCGTRKVRGTIDLIFTAQHLQDKCQRTECEQLHDLCRLHQSILYSDWRWMLKNYCKVWLSSQVLSNSWQFITVQINGEFSEPIRLNKIVLWLQSCYVLATLHVS